MSGKLWTALILLQCFFETERIEMSIGYRFPQYTEYSGSIDDAEEILGYPCLRLSTNDVVGHIRGDIHGARKWKREKVRGWFRLEPITGRGVSVPLKTFNHGISPFRFAQH